MIYVFSGDDRVKISEAVRCWEMSMRFLRGKVWGYKIS